VSSKAISVRCRAGLVLSCALLAIPVCAMAQRHGGAGASTGQGSLHSYSRPDGVDEKDDLKDFHQALALEATSEQIAEYNKLIKNTGDAQAQLHALREHLDKQEPAAELTSRHTAVEQALERARTGTRGFVGGFSSAQKSGLKDVTKRLAKADLDLEQYDKTLDSDFHDPEAVGSKISARATALEKALAEFENQQLALGRQMSIVLASGQDSTFMLPRVKNAVQIADHTVEISTSGALSQTAAEASLRTFQLELITDLSDLQQSMTELLASRLSRSEACGERLDIRQASLMPATPVIVVDVRLHYERWLCTHMYGQPAPNELAEGDAAVEVKLVPSIGQSNRLQLSAQLEHVEAKGMVADELLSGDLGNDLRDAVRQIILPAVETGAKLTVELPLAVQSAVTLETARFQQAGVGGLNVTLVGRLQMTDEQANALANRLNQSLTAQGNQTR
jgi:hypothetical protein